MRNGCEVHLIVQDQSLSTAKLGTAVESNLAGRDRLCAFRSILLKPLMPVALTDNGASCPRLSDRSNEALLGLLTHALHCQSSPCHHIPPPW